MRPKRAIAELEELTLLRHALARVNDFVPGKLRVAIEFHTPIRSSLVRDVINETATKILRGVLTAAELRVAIAAKLSERIAELELRFPGLVDGG